MRDAFVIELLSVARQDPNIMLIVGDLGYGVVDEFARALPDQFLNAGVAEQNMVGMAAGLATSGYRVFVYSIANFPTLRALEQIRNDVCYHDLNVTIVSVGAGVSYGTLGYSHHAVEDISIMRALPNMRVLCPADSLEAKAAVHDVLAHSGPAYVRLGKSGEPIIHVEIPTTLTCPIRIGTGSDVLLIGTGAVVAECVEAAKILAKSGLSVGTLSCPTVKPMDTTWLNDVPQTVFLVTVEEHTLDGGFGSAVLEQTNALSRPRRVLRIGLKNRFQSQVGSQGYLRSLHGLDAAQIAETVLDGLRAIP
jgi:transketolase